MTLSKHQKDIIRKMQAGWQLTRVTMGLYERYELEGGEKSIGIAKHTIRVLQKFQLIVILDKNRYFAECKLTENAERFN